MNHSNLLACTLCFLLLASGCDRGVETVPNGEFLVLGVIAPMEGLNGFKGRRAMAGIEKGLRVMPYSLGGTEILVQLETAEDEATTTVAAVKRLAANPEVAAVISLAGSDAMLAVGPVVNELEIPVLAASASNPAIPAAGPWLSQVIYDDSFQGAVAALFVRDELLIKRVAVVSNPDNAYSRYLAERFIEKFRSIGGEITEQLHIGDAAGDYADELATARQSEPELIYMTVDTEKLVAIGEALQALKWRPQLMGPDGSLSSLVKQFPERIHLFEGMHGTDVYTSKVPLSRIGVDYRRISRQDLQDLDTYAVLGIEAVAIVVDAFERCGEVDVSRACIAQEIRQTRDFAGLLGRISIAEDGRAIRPLVINAISKGNIVYRVRVY